MKQKQPDKKQISKSGKSGGKQQADSPTRDVHHDEKRRNGFDPDVARKIGSSPEK
jgi:hypothetical protein